MPAQPPPAKRVKEEQPHAEIDPEQLGDVLNAAGVDLREEESLLNSGLMSEPGGIAGARLLHAPRDPNDMLLDYDVLRRLVAKKTADYGLRIGYDDGMSSLGLNQDPLGLLSASCEEWLASILSEAAAYSRHRRLTLTQEVANENAKQEAVNPVTKALRKLAEEDKEAEAKRVELKAQLGIGEDAKKPEKISEKENEEIMQKAANDTARMMTAAVGRKKKFSWMSSGNAGGAQNQRLAGARSKNADAQKVREVKEDNGIVLRDLLPVLEEKHMGVKKVLMRGYARLRN